MNVIRRASFLPVRAVQQRMMGGGGHGKPKQQFTGFEAKVRAVLPESKDMALGYMGFYAGLYVLYKVFSKKSKPEVAAPAAVSGGDMPSSDSAEFGEWLGKEGNVEKLFSSA